MWPPHFLIAFLPPNMSVTDIPVLSLCLFFMATKNYDATRVHLLSSYFILAKTSKTKTAYLRHQQLYR